MMTRSRIEKVLEILDQMEEVLGLYGNVIYPLADDNQKKAIIKSVGKADDMIDELMQNIEDMKRR